MLSTGPADVGGAIAESVAGPRASVWVRVRGAGVEACSGGEEGAAGVATSVGAAAMGAAAMGADSGVDVGGCVVADST